MSNLKTLIKYDFINSYGLNKLKDKDNRLKNIGLLGVIIFSICVIAFSIYEYFNLMVEPLKAMNMLEYILIQGIVLIFLLTFVTTIYKAPGMIFGLKDYNTLISMPVKPSEILISKLVNLVIPSYLFMLIVYIPILTIYFKNVDFSILNIFFAVILYFFIPIVPISIGSLIAFLISYSMSKMKSKNIFSIIMLSFFTIAILVLSMQMEGIMKYLTINASNITEALGRVYPPIVFFLDAVAFKSVGSLIKFVLFSTIIFICFIFIFSKVFQTISSRLLENSKKDEFKMVELKDSKVSIALFKKELSAYLSKPLVVLNTAIGPIMMIIMPVVVLIGGNSMIEKMFKLESLEGIIQGIAIASVLVMIGLSNISASLISLEGNKIWIVRSLPISEMEIFKGKILLSLATSLVPFIISLPFYILAFKLSLENIIILTIGALVISVYVAILGLLLNLKFPMMNWTSETVVVKQSASSFLSLLLGGGPLALAVFLYIKLNITNMTLYLIFGIGLFLVLDVILFILLKNYGVKRLREI